MKKADKRTLKGKQSEWNIILKGNDLQAPATLLTTLREEIKQIPPNAIATNVLLSSASA